MSATDTSWTGNCTRCRDRVTVTVITTAGRPLPVDLDPDRFVCGQCRDPQHAGRQLELDQQPEPDVFGTGRHETTSYPPDMVALPEGL